MAGHRLRAGVAASDITTDSPDALIRDRLYAKALVLEHGSECVAIVTMDTTAIGGRLISRGALPDIGESFLPTLRARAERELGIRGERILVNASHTHPPGRMNCGDDEQVERVLDALRRARDGMADARVGSGSGGDPGIAMNRTLRLVDGRHWSLRHAYPSPPEEEIAGYGPVDHEIGILRVDRADVGPLCVLYNFACHPLFGDARGSITANFPGVASRYLESRLGPGALALFLQGAAGDIIDVSFKDWSRPRDIEPLGVALGRSTLEAARSIVTGAASIACRARTLELPRRTDVPSRVASLRREQAELLASLRYTSLDFSSFLPLYNRYGAPGAGGPQDGDMDALNRRNLAKYVRNLRAMERLARIEDDIATLLKHEAINAESGSPTQSAELLGIRIGDCAIVSSPAELCAEVGLNLKCLSPFPRTLVAGYSNGYLHYGPAAADYDKGGYEVTECLLAPEWQRMYEEAARETLEELRDR